MTDPGPNTRTLNVVWRRRVLDNFLEASFIRSVLLSGLQRPHRWIAIEDDAGLPLLDDVLICSFGDPGPYIQQLRAAGHVNIGIFHLGDETGQDDRVFYASADYVLRHYWTADDEDAFGDAREIGTWVPNGWATGVGPGTIEPQIPFLERTHDIFFAGFAGNSEGTINERAMMLDALRKNRVPATVILSDGFGQGLGAVSYAAYMSDSKLALVPGGNAPETIRFYDALECGALPVILDGSWLHSAKAAGALGDPPVITLRSWAEIADVAAFLHNPETARELSERAGACRTWWNRFKHHIANRTAEIIEASFNRFMRDRSS